MRVLAIECSTEWLAVALSDGPALAERREHASQSHSERVLPLVRALLDEAGLELSGIDGIAFGAGPGSFTGVRIACGVAQGLALGASLPVVPVGTLEAIAEDAYVKHGSDRVFACIDARMREVYVAAYVREAGGWREAQPPAVLKPANVTLPPGRWFGAGDGFVGYPDVASGLGLDGCDATLHPSASAVARLASPRLAAGKGLPPERALPFYVRHRVALTTAERAAGAVL